MSLRRPRTRRERMIARLDRPRELGSRTWSRLRSRRRRREVERQTRLLFSHLARAVRPAPEAEPPARPQRVRLRLRHGHR